MHKKYKRLIVAILLGIAIVFALLFYLVMKYEVNSIILVVVGFSLIIAILVFMGSLYNVIPKLKGALEKQNINFASIRASRKEIISGKKSEVGNIRVVDKYKCEIDDYHCILTYYEKQELVQTYSYQSDMYSYTYRKQHDYLEYNYDLSFFKLTASKEELNGFRYLVLKNGDLQNVVDAVYTDGHLIVTKEFEAKQYGDSNAESDVKDIKNIYDEFVKFIKENNYGSF